jgi:zinc transport system ATP-binding protein
MGNAVEIKNLSFTFNGHKVLKDINIIVPENQYLAIIGPNGGGKSTLLKIILGLLKPDRGEIKIFKKPPEKARNLIGYLPQHISFLPEFPINVMDIVLTGRYHGILKSYTEDDREKSLEALEKVGMAHLADAQVGQLSGGQKQRVFLARALVRNPRLLLLDEPMASIDPQMQQSFYQLTKKLKKEITIILVTHDVGAVSDQVDLIACLNQKLYYHGITEGAGDALENVYGCPLELISHGKVPHRILKDH